MMGSRNKKFNFYKHNFKNTFLLFLTLLCVIGSVTIYILPFQSQAAPTHLPPVTQTASSFVKTALKTISDQFNSKIQAISQALKLKDKSKSALTFIAMCCIAVLTIIVGFLLLNARPANATEIPTNVTVDYDPLVSTILLTDSDGGTLQVWANDSRIFNCTGTVYDGDGFADLGTVNGTIWGFGSNYSAANSAGLHYSNSTCLKYGSAGNTSSYTCSFYVHHHTENGTWICNVSINDTYARTGTNQTTNTVDVFKSISVPLQTIAFGSYAHGQNSGTTDYTVTINNTGNAKFNVTLDAYRVSGVPADINSMSCASGTLPVGSIAYSTVPGTAAISKTALTDAPKTISANVSVTAFGSTAPVPYSFYLGIIIPATGMSGKCAGFLDVSAS